MLLVLDSGPGLLFRYVVAERIGTILLSALVAHTAWHWALDRGTASAGYPLPALDAAATLAALVRLLMVIVVAAGLVWLVASLVAAKRLARGGLPTRGQGAGQAQGSGVRRRISKSLQQHQPVRRRRRPPGAIA